MAQKPPSTSSNPETEDVLHDVENGVINKTEGVNNEVSNAINPNQPTFIKLNEESSSSSSLNSEEERDGPQTKRPLTKEDSTQVYYPSKTFKNVNNSHGPKKKKVRVRRASSIHYKEDGTTVDMKHSSGIHLLRLIHIPMGWFLLMAYFLMFKSVLSFIFFFPFMCFSLVEPTYIFATMDKEKEEAKGVFGNLALIWYTYLYLFVIYIGSITVEFMQLTQSHENFNLLRDIGITQLHSFKTIETSTTYKYHFPTADGYDVTWLKVPMTIILLIVFCIIYRYRVDMDANRKMFKEKSHMRIRVLYHMYDKMQGTRIIALVLMFTNAIIVPDLIRLPFMIFFCLFTIHPSISQRGWILAVLWTMLLIISLYFWNFSFVVDSIKEGANKRQIMYMKTFFKFEVDNSLDNSTNVDQQLGLSNVTNSTGQGGFQGQIQVDPNQLIVPIIVLIALVLQYMIYRKSHKHDNYYCFCCLTNKKKLKDILKKHNKTMEEKQNWATADKAKQKSNQKISAVAQYYSTCTPTWMIRMRPVLFFLLVFIKYSVIVAIFFKIDVNAVSMIYLIFPIIVLFYSMCVMEPKKEYHSEQRKWHLSETDVYDYNAQVLRRVVTFFKRVSFTCAIYSGLVLLTQYAIVSLYTFVKPSVSTEECIDIEMCLNGTRQWVESGFYIVNADTLAGNMQWAGYGENVAVLFLSALIGSFDRQWVTQGFDVKRKEKAKKSKKSGRDKKLKVSLTLELKKRQTLMMQHKSKLKKSSSAFSMEEKEGGRFKSVP